MTIAAGFVARDGVLLCADTLYTDGYTKEYRDKIFVWAAKKTSVVFALAGSDSIGRMAIDDCRHALSMLKLKDLTTEGILGNLKGIVKYVQEQFVDSRPLEERDASQFSLFIAIKPHREAPSLFTTTKTVINPVATFDCIGSGRHLGLHLISTGYRPSIGVEEAAVLGIQALAATKEHVDGVGGRSEFIVIKNGLLSPVVGHDVNTSEPLVARYQKACAELLFRLSDAATTEDDFKRQQLEFAHSVTHFRASWLKESEPWRKLQADLSI